MRHEIRWIHGSGLRQGPAPDILHPPRLQVSTDCCAHDSFIPFPGGADMAGGTVGSQRVYPQPDFPGLTGTFCLRAATTTGDPGGVGAHTQ